MRRRCDLNHMLLWLISALLFVLFISSDYLHHKEIKMLYGTISAQEQRIEILTKQLSESKAKMQTYKPTNMPSRGALAELFELTGYCICEQCCGKTDGITASGAQAKPGITIAAPASIPFGTKVFIPGVGERIVQDRGGAITEHHIDILFESHQQALDFGRKTMEVFINE